MFTCIHTHQKVKNMNTRIRDTKKAYAVSDDAGNYIDYFDNLKDAEERALEGTEELRESGEEFGQYAVMQLVRNGSESYYELM